MSDLAMPQAGRRSTRATTGLLRAAVRRLLTFVIPAKAGIQSSVRRILQLVIPAKAGIQAGLRRLIRLLIEPIGPSRADPAPRGRRAHVPARGAWESACGWEARWNAWLASPSSPIWRGDGEEPNRPRG